MSEMTNIELLDALVNRVRWNKDDGAARTAILARMSPGWQPMSEAESYKLTGEMILCLYSDGYRALREWKVPRHGFCAHWCWNGTPAFGDDPIAFTTILAAPFAPPFQDD